MKAQLGRIGRLVFALLVLGGVTFAAGEAVSGMGSSSSELCTWDGGGCIDMGCHRPAPCEGMFYFCEARMVPTPYCTCTTTCIE